MSNPFDYLNSINQNKNNMMRGSENDELSEKEYVPFMVNRGLSYFPDTLAFANEMNLLHHLDKKLQYEFLLNTIRPRKRFSKWFKAEENESLDVICRFYKCGKKRAAEHLLLLSEDQIQELRKKLGMEK